MNYGKDSVSQKLRQTGSNAEKVASKLILIFVKIILSILFICIIVGASLGYGVLKGIIDSAPKIDVASIEPSGYATMVYDSKGNLTETLVQSGSNRLEATYEELPKDLINAFIAIEDSRFWSHKGVDFRSILRAAIGVLTNNPAGGGSTLTQQLIKNNVFSGGNESSFGEKIERKIQEQYLAIQLERTMDKKIILKNYLNTINLGNNTLGVKSAAQRYFGKDVSDLTLSECAVIAGITQNPTKYNPLSENGRKNNEEKRRLILQYMYEQDLITKEEQEEALADDVYSRIRNNDIIAQEENQEPYSYFTDELIDQVLEAFKDKLGYSETQAYNLLYSGGLEIYTTQDPDMQAIVDEEINNPANYDAALYSVDYRLSILHADGTQTHYSDESLVTYIRKELGNASFNGLFSSKEQAAEYIESYRNSVIGEGDSVAGESVYYILEPQASFVLMDQKTGYVKALRGGRGDKELSRSLNRASDTYRQPGSCFKVVTSFAPALDACGATLGSVYYDAPLTVGTKTFKNWYNGYYGYSNIRDGIVYSMNIVAVRCMIETVTPQLGVEYAKKFGITSLTDSDLNAATALGGITKGVSNLELTAAYATIANGGMYTKPVFFTKILDHNGKVLLENEPETRRVLKDSTAFLLTDAMAQSVTGSRIYSSGSGIGNTSGQANIDGMSNAGKSGTTTNNVDIWFVGYTPYYTAGIWSGCDDNQKITAIGSGNSYHKVLWRKIMSRVHEGLSDTGFEVPDSVESAKICRKSGKLAIAGVCDSDPRGSAVYTEYFAKGTVPTEICDHHVQITVCSESGGSVTEFCPEEGRTSRTCMIVPEGESGGTDDSRYVRPAPCTVHTQAAVTEPAETDDAGIITPLTPTVPEGETSAVGRRRGPGYEF